LLNLFVKRSHEFLNELKIIPTTIIASLGLGFGSSMLVDILFGFAISHLFYFSIRLLLDQLILKPLLGDYRKLLKCLASMSSAFVLPCLTSVLLGQPVAALIASALLGMLGAKTLQLALTWVANRMFDSELMLLELGGYGVKALAMIL